MSKKKKIIVQGGGDSWMNTYADMVTLLLCFFVLLYASSTPDETKWQYIFQSFTTSGKYINPFVAEENPDYMDATEEDDGISMEPTAPEDSENKEQIIGSESPENFDDFTAWFQSSVAGSNFADDISIEQVSSTRIKIVFDAAILFQPDSAVLTSGGQDAIDLMLPGIKAINEYIGGIEVTGHTAKSVSVVNDWDLSAARACSVVKYMDFQRVVESECYVPMGRGPYEPIADNDTEEGRAENRRVELEIIRNDNKIENTDVLKDILLYDYGINQGISDSGVSNSDDVSQIIGKLEDKYNTTISDSGDILGEESGPSLSKPITGIPDDVLHELDEEGNIITDDSESGDSDEAEEASEDTAS